MRPSDTSNPYAPASEASLAPEAAAKPSPEQKKTFRWQILPSLFCILAIVFCLFLICVLAFEIQDIRSRWDNFSVPYAHLLALAADIFIISLAAVAFAFAARRWVVSLYITAIAGSIVGTMLVALVIPNEFFLLDFFQDLTLRIGWDSYD